jgi:GT2 family glycosyltransferase
MARDRSYCRIAASHLPILPPVLDAQGVSSGSDGGVSEWPRVTLVYLAFNRRDEIRESLQRMLFESDYESELVDVIVVDNASTDGTAEMLREQFPQVKLIVRDENVGVSGWNDGLAAATGEYVLALDDDCYLPPHGLRRAVEAAGEHDADLVSFKVVSSYEPDHVFTEYYRTGLFAFWGCAVLMRRRVVEALGGYDPQIFIWANELEFLLRFFDHGFCHLHLPEVVAQHMKAPGPPGGPFFTRAYCINSRHFAYIAAKLFARRDAAEAFVALLARNIRDGMRLDRSAIRGVRYTFAGFLHGLRHRAPLRNREVSRFYRRNFESFASPWWLSRPIPQLIRALPRELIRGRKPKNVGRLDEFFGERNRFYPAERAETLRF